MACGTESRQESAAPHHASTSTTTVSPLFASDDLTLLRRPWRFLASSLAENLERSPLGDLLIKTPKAVGVATQAPSAVAYRE
jgi:hypothetical protein